MSENKNKQLATVQTVDWQKGEFFRVHEQAASVEARLLCTFPPVWWSAPSAYWGNHLKRRKTQIWQLGTGSLTLLEHLQLLQFYFQNIFLVALS